MELFHVPIPIITNLNAIILAKLDMKSPLEIERECVVRTRFSLEPRQVVHVSTNSIG